ncbi:MAG: T9SS type A sorting domain-containing protein [Bacteroidetes bacterium]|nr:T9SS type A sorting domain-containing protein [Bacteroidota bacterium]
MAKPFKKLVFLAVLLALFCTKNSFAQVDVSTGGGPTTYTTLKAAFDAINAGTHTGAITISITANTTEAGPCVLNSSGAGSASYTSVNIRPTTDGVTISGPTTTGRGLIELKGADNVTIDGDNPNTGGTNRNLTITNTAAATITYTSVIRICNAATVVTSSDNNIFRNLILNGSAADRNAAANTSVTGSENTTFGIYVGGNGGASATDAPTAITSVTTNTAPTGTTVNALLVDNNTVMACARGIVFNGAAVGVSTGVTISNNIIGDQSAQSFAYPQTTPTNTVYTKGIYASGTTVLTITGNSIKNIFSYVAVGTTNAAGIDVVTAIGTGPNTISNNTIAGVVVNNAATTSPARGISLASSAGVYTVAGNTISNVQNNCGSTTQTNQPTGLYISTAAASATVERNIVSQVYDRNAGTFGVAGVFLAAGNNITFRNNMIYDINQDITGGAAFSTQYGIIGLRILGTGHKIYYNSIHLSGAMLGTSTTTIMTVCATINTTSVTGVDMRNNIFSNVMTGGTTSIAHVSLFLPSAATSTLNLTLNNNAYFSGSDASRQGILQVGTTAGSGFYLASNFIASSTTPSTNSRSYTSTLSAAGTNDNASIASTSAAPFTSATDLHIPALTATQLESGGVIVAGTTTDYDNQNRYPNAGYPDNPLTPATAPDIGADEFAGTIVDLTAPSIVYTALGNTASTADRTLTAAISDASGVAGGANGPRLYYKKSSEITYHFDDAPIVAGSNYTFTINAAAMGGLAANDVVQYYVAAQDVNANVATSPAGGSGINPPGTVAPLAPNSYIIAAAPMSGTYTVGLALFNRVTGKNIYSVEKVRTVTREVSVTEDAAVVNKSDKEAFTASLNAPNVKTQTVTVDEKYSVLMENGTEYRGSLYHELSQSDRSSNGITSDMAGVYATITAAVADVNLRGVSGNTELSLTDASYPSETFPITFNIGSDAQPSASATITMKPALGVSPTISGTLASNALIKIFSSYTIIDGSNTVGGSTKDMTITNISATSPSVLQIGSNGTTYNTASTVKNCILINGVNTASCLVVGDAGTLGNPGYFANTTIQNNSIQKSYIGMYINANASSTSYANVNGNDLTTSGANAIRFTGIYMQAVNGSVISQNSIANFETTSSEDDNGVWLATGTINTTVERNSIYTLKYTGTNGYGAHGVQVSSGTTSCNITVRNNQIADLSGDGWVNTTLGDNTHGIYVFGTTTGVKLYNNSINFNGNTLNQTGAMSYGITLGTGSTADIRNNVISNNLGLLGATGLGSTCIFLQTDATQLEASDNNVYYCSPTGSGVKDIAKVGTTDYSTLSAYATVTGKDKGSFNGNPSFVNSTSGSIDITNANSWVVNGNGYPGLVTNDINGTARSTSLSTGPCDVGAYEITPSVPAPSATQTGTIGAGQTTSWSIFGKTFASITWGAAGTYPGSMTAAFNSGATPPNPPVAAKYGYGYWTLTPDVQPSGGATYDITVFFSDAQTGTITAPATNLILAKYDGATWTDYQPGVGAGQSNLNYAAKSVTVAGLTSFSSFALTDKDAPLPVELSSFTSAIDKRKVTLNWSTVSEENNSGFDIERKLSGTENTWSKVGNVAGAGNSTTAKSYSFSENNLNTGKYNYRLKQMDYNGNFKYYDLSNEVIIGVPSKFDISQNYPNPFNPSTKINFDLPFDSKVQIKIYDMTGKEMAQIVNESRTAGYYTVQFNASMLSSGIYFYQINAAGGNQSFVKTMKMVLVK